MTTRAGRSAEQLAALWLVLHGWRVVARNWRGAGGELDLVARRGRVLAVCEVKARSDATWLYEPVRAAQVAHIARTARAFLVARPDLAALQIRLDVVTVGGRGLRRRVRHHAGVMHAPRAGVVSRSPGGRRWS